MEARDERPLLRRQKLTVGQKLLIIDELGFVPLSKTGAELLFDGSPWTWAARPPPEDSAAVLYAVAPRISSAAAMAVNTSSGACSWTKTAAGRP